MAIQDDIRGWALKGKTICQELSILAISFGLILFVMLNFWLVVVTIANLLL